MNQPSALRNGCAQCADEQPLDFDFTMAFQPIVNARTGTIFAQEALVRGLNKEPAGEVFRHVNDDNLYRFDQACRIKAIRLAAKLGMTSKLSINFMPNAVYKPELCIRTTMQTASECHFPIEQIIFETTEGERVKDHAHLAGIFEHYKSRGFSTAIDDFGAGYSGLNLLAEFQPNIVKLDMALIRDIHQHKSRKAIVRGVVQVCSELDIDIIAEGIENREELLVLRELGIELFQGFYFARPAFESQAQVPAELFAGLG